MRLFGRKHRPISLPPKPFDATGWHYAYKNGAPVVLYNPLTSTQAEALEEYERFLAARTPYERPADRWNRLERARLAS